MNVHLSLGALPLFVCISTLPASAAAPCAPSAPCAIVVYEVNDTPSWIFRRGTYTHDPATGARVAQYMRIPPVEPLDDERLVTSRYRRSRTNLRGAHGSVDTYYEVQAWGNGRGGIDAEWERFHDAWKESYLSGGYYNQGPGNVPPWWQGGYGPGIGYGHPSYGYPGYGYGGHGYGGQGQGGHWNGHGGHNHGHGDDDDHNGGGDHGGGHHGGGHDNDED